MKKYLLAALLTCCPFVFADATLSTHILNISGASMPHRNFVRLELKGCAGYWPQVPGFGNVDLVQDFYPDLTGAISSTIKANNQIQCNGIYSDVNGNPITYYRVTYYSNGVPQSSASYYVLNTTTFDPSVAPTISGVPASGNLVDVNVRNFTAFDTITGVNGIYTNQVISPKFVGNLTLLAAPPICPAGQVMNGFNADLSPLCVGTNTIGLGFTPLNTTPLGNQSVTQPSGTTTKYNSFNYVRYADPANGIDLIAQVNALFLSCAYSCEVHIPAGNYNITSGQALVDGPILINHATQSLTADGKDKVRITYAGTNALDWRFSNSTYDFNATGTVSGFTITCSNLAAICMSGGSTAGSSWRDLDIYGPGGITNASPVGTSQGLVFQNTFDWMERWSMVNVNIGGFSKNVHFLAPSGGTDSFGYGLVDGVWTNQGPGTQGWVVDAGANVYNMLGFKYQYNGSLTTNADEVFHIAGTFQGEGFNVTGEGGANITFAHVLTGGIMRFQGDYNIFSGVVTTDAVTTAFGLPSFWIRPTAGLLGVNGGVSGAGTIANWNGTGNTYRVIPSEYLEPSNPFVPAFMGYMEAPGGASTPIMPYDPTISFCHTTHAINSASNALARTWCVDGSGNVVAQGSDTATSFNTLGSYKLNGVSTLLAASNLAVGDGDIVIASGLSLSGIYTIDFVGPNRKNMLTIAANANQFGTTVSLNVLSNFAYASQVVISNPRIVLDSGSTPQLVVTISNRNAGTSLYVNQLADGAAPSALLPGTTVGTTATTNVIVPVLPPIAASFTTTISTVETVTLAGMTTSGHCSVAPTNASAATNVATTYISAKLAGSIQLTHSATAGMALDVLCTSY